MKPSVVCSVEICLDRPASALPDEAFSLLEKKLSLAVCEWADTRFELPFFVVRVGAINSNNI